VQAYILFRAKLLPPFKIASKTSESLETRLFSPAAIPFDDIAFSSVALALRCVSVLCSVPMMHKFRVSAVSGAIAFEEGFNMLIPCQS